MISIRTQTLLLNAFLFFAVLSALLGTLFAVLICILAFGTLYYFHIEPVAKEKSDTVLSSSPEDVEIIGHRGAAADAPENTIEAFRLAKENGATGIELDVDFTKDGVAVILHDGTVDRTTDGTGEIGRLNYDDVKKLNAAAKHPKSEQFSGVRIPTLEEGVIECLKLGLKLYMDCKGDFLNKSSLEKISNLIVKIYQKYPELYKRAIVCSLHPQVILAIRRKDPAIVTALTHRQKLLTLESADSTKPRFESRWLQWMAPGLDLILEWSHYGWLWYLCGNSAFLAHRDQVSVNFVKFWQSLGIHVLVWTANDAEQKDFCLKSLRCAYMTDTLSDPTTKRHLQQI